MAGIVVEYARFLEVRQRRARITEEFIQPPAQPEVDTRSPASVQDEAVQVRVPGPSTPVNRDVVDGR